MNKRLKELAEQAGLPYYGLDIERFADLVRQDEREACAKLCDIHANNGASFVCAETIRARGNHEQD